MASPVTTWQLAWPLSPYKRQRWSWTTLVHYCYHHSLHVPCYPCAAQICVLHWHPIKNRRSPIMSTKEIKQKNIFSLVLLCEWKKKQEIIKSNPSPFLLQASSISFYIYIAYNNNKKEWWPDSDATKVAKGAVPDATGRSCRWWYKPPAISGSRAYQRIWLMSESWDHPKLFLIFILLYFHLYLIIII
jgi:hypothetical protein